jgi:Raf kinase inhibitor-like YbhB/YbcL family protein
VLVALFLSFAGGCKRSGGDTQPEEVAMKIELKSTAFAEGADIPPLYTDDGKDISPSLQWAEPPPQTKSFALICDDPDAPRGTWVHWVLFNLPADQRRLEEAMPAKETLTGGAKQGKNDFGKIGYGGPAPPAGKPHRYFFKLYVLDTMLDLAPGATKEQVLAAMKGHILAEGQLMGRFQR